MYSGHCQYCPDKFASRSRERHAGHRRSKHTMLAESAIQKATKFHEPHLRRAASTGNRN